MLQLSYVNQMLAKPNTKITLTIKSLLALVHSVKSLRNFFAIFQETYYNILFSFLFSFFSYFLREESSPARSCIQYMLLRRTLCMVGQPRCGKRRSDRRIAP